MFLYNPVGRIKNLFFVGASLEALRSFPHDARREAGHQLHLIQLGGTPSDFKPMKTVGSGVYEIRIHTRIEYRVIYLSRRKEGVYVLHAFERKTRQTRQSDIELAKDRLKAVNAPRRSATRTQR